MNAIHSKVTAALIAALALAPIACGDDPVDPPVDESLTAAETAALVAALQALLSTDVNVLQGLVALPTVPCPLGGAVNTSGTVTPTGPASATWAIGLVPVDCAVTEGTLVFTLNGNPNIDYNGSLSTDLQTGVATIAATVTGGATWALADRTGDCTASLNIDVTANADGSGSVSTTGTMCGHQISMTATL